MNNLDTLLEILKTDKRNAFAQYRIGILCEEYLNNYKKANAWYTAAKLNGLDGMDVHIIRTIQKMEMSNIKYEKSKIN